MLNYEQLMKTNSNTVDYRSVRFDFDNKFYLVESTNGLFTVKMRKKIGNWDYSEWTDIGIRFSAPIESTKEFLINRTLDEINDDSVADNG